MFPALAGELNLGTEKALAESEATKNMLQILCTHRQAPFWFQ